MADVKSSARKATRQKHERRERIPQDKERSNAQKRPTTDPAIAARQRVFCKSVISDILEDDGALSFSKPVTELWDVDDLHGYFDKVRYICFLPYFRLFYVCLYSHLGTCYPPQLASTCMYVE